MKRAIFTGFLLIVAILLHGQSACLNDVQIIDSVIYKDGKIYTGDYECFYKNGKIKEKGFIKNGIFDSISFYKKNGTLTEILWFENNKPSTRRLYRNAFNTKLIINVKNDIEHGPWERYYLNGRIKEQKYFDNGKSVGLWKTWDRKGKVRSEIDFTKNPIVEKYHEYKKDKHMILIYYTDKTSGKRIKD